MEVFDFEYIDCCMQCTKQGGGQRCEGATDI